MTAPQVPASRRSRQTPAPAPREELIRAAAYFRAERRGFAPGGALDDWLEAEREIDRWIETRGAPHRYSAPPRL